MERDWFFHYLTHVPPRNYAACTGTGLSPHWQHPSVLLPSFSLSPQFVQIFTLLTANTLIQPQTNAAQDLQANLDSLSQLLVLLWPRPRPRLPPPYMCKQEPAADGLLSAGGRFRVEQWGLASHSTTSPAHARAAALCLSRLGRRPMPKFSSVLCLLGGVSGREGALEKTHEPLPDLANGYFSHTPPKDSSSSQMIYFMLSTERKAEQQMAPLTARGRQINIWKALALNW